MKSLFVIITISLMATPFQAMARPVTVVTDSGSYCCRDTCMPEGPWIDLAAAIMSEAHIDTYGVEIHPWARVYNTALKYENTMILPLAMTEKRKNLFKWAGMIIPVRFFLVSRKDTNHAEIDSLSSAKAYRIGVMRNDVSHAYLEDQGFTRLFPASRIDLLIKMLDGKRVDMICITHGSMALGCRKNGVDCSEYLFEWEVRDLSLKLHLAFNRNTDDRIVRQVREGFERVKLTPAYEAIIRQLSISN